MRLSHIVVASVVGLVAAVGAGGCSSSSSDTPAAPAGVGEHKSVDIKAAEGGTVAVTGGSIDIPPGALAADTTITVDVKDKSAFPNAADVAVNVFDYGPNGTKFLKPVAMSIDLQGVAVPDGKTAKIAYYDGSAWKSLDDSKVVNGKVTATTTHFTPFTVVFSGGTQTGGSCGQFNACGGDLTGTWTYTVGCATIPTSALGAPWSTCATASVTATVDLNGTITFNADNTYALNANIKLSRNGTLPKSCLGAGQTCQSLIKPQNGESVVDTGTECQVSAPSNSNGTETGTWATSGTNLTATKTGSSPGAPSPYCVNGNTLTVEAAIGSQGAKIQYTATK
jgi:hypothetical protein